MIQKSVTHDGFKSSLCFAWLGSGIRYNVTVYICNYCFTFTMFIKDDIYITLQAFGSLNCADLIKSLGSRSKLKDSEKT